MARLLEDTEPTQFWSGLEKGIASGKSTVSKAGVRIGHEVNSCTVVPMPFDVKGNHSRLFITDMPGFAETNAEKKISIDILQKCYMTTVKKFRLLIVVEIEKIFETRFLTLRDDYHKALWQLFGSDYPNAIPHFYFILTKKNVLEHLDGTVESKLNRGIRELMTRASDRDTSMFAQFLARMCDHNCVVDLETHDNVSLMEDIQGMIQEGDDEAKGLHIPSFDVVQLAAGENRLNMLCTSFLNDTALVEQKKLASKTNTCQEAWDREEEELIQASDELRREMGKAEKEFKHSRKMLTATEASISAYPGEHQKLSEAISSSQRKIIVCGDKLEIFKKEMKDDDFVDVRVDCSVKSKTLGRATKYVSEINADVKSSGSKEDIILVMEYEEDDKTLRQSIGMDDSLIPRSIQQLEQFDIPDLLYSSKTNVHRGGCEVERPPVPSDQGVRWIKIKRDKPFKVYIFTARRFCSMPFYARLLEEFEKEVSSEKEHCAHLESELKLLDEKNRKDKQDRITLTQRVKVAIENVRGLNASVDEQLTVYETNIDAFLADLSELEEEVLKLQTQETIKQVDAVINIFRTNKIATKATPVLEEFHRNFNNIFHDISQLRAKVDAFKKTSLEVVTDIKSTSGGEEKKEEDPFDV